MINRHIRLQALKTAEKRGNHPAIGTVGYQNVAKYRNFIQPAVSEEERRERISQSDLKYREIRIAGDRKKVEAAFKVLQYCPILL